MTKSINIKIIMLTMLIGYLFTLSAFGEGRLFNKIPAVEGLDNNRFTTYDITRTSDGFTWFATDRGLLRFDGEYAVKIPLNEENSDNETVKVLVPADDGGLILSTASGLYRLDTQNRHHVMTRLMDGKPLSASSALSVPGKFALIGSDEGLIVFTPDGQSRQIKVRQDILDLSNKVIDMSLGKDRIFILTKGGIYSLDMDTFATEQIGDAESVEKLGGTALATTDKYVYIGTSGNGVWRLNISDGELKEAFEFSKGNVVTSMKVNRDGSALFVGTDGGGVTRISLPSEEISAQARHLASDPNSLSSNQVYSIFTDDDGHLWVGYYQNGVDYTPSWNGLFELVDDPSSFNTRDVPVRALSLDNGRITIGTREGIVVFERSCSTAWTVRSPELRSEMVISLLNHNGKTFIGTYGGGLQILDPISRQVSDLPVKGYQPIFRSGHIFALASDKDGNLWVGTNHGLLKKPEGKEPIQYTSANSGLPDGNVYGIFFDSEGKGWICTESGLCVYDPRQEKLRTDLFPADFPRQTRFRTVYEDSRHRLYFVPEKGMVMSSNMDLSGPSVFTHPLLDGADAKGVVEDGRGNIWIPTNKGIFRVDDQGHVIRFGLASGLPSPLFLQSQPVSDSVGHIWFGNSAGLMRLSESNIESSIEAQRPLVPTVLKINGMSVDFVPRPEESDGSYHIDIDKSSNTVRIEFSTFSYAFEEPESFIYSLDGGKWQRFTKDLSVTLYELSPASHELRVKAANDSEGEPDMTVVKIHIPYPAWWYILGVLVVALLICGVIVWRQLRRKSNEKQEVDTSVAVSDENTEAVETEEVVQRQKYASNTLTRNEAREIARKIEEVMEKEKPYLNSELKVGDLAALAGISSHRLSQFFSQHKGQTFYDYVNRFRVEEFKRLVKEDKTRSLTLSAMAEKAGFSSRASFFRHFKNIEGISPGEYLKNNE